MLLAMQGRSLPIHGDGSNVRSYLYCEDVAEAFEVVLHKGMVGHVYNIGTKKERRVLDVAKDICKLFNIDAEKAIKFVDNRPFNDQRYFLDDKKLKVLAWEEGLKKTMEWYVKNPDWWGDVTGALVPHPRMLAIGGIDRIPENNAATTDLPNNGVSEKKQQTQIAISNGDPKIVVEKKTSPKESQGNFKFLIYGRTGWIGGLLGEICGKQGIEYHYGLGRLENRSQLEDDIGSIKPTHVFNAAGVTGRPNVDWCESHKTETIRSNVVGTLTLADVCLEHGLLLVNFATGCIFEYDAKHPLGSGVGFLEADTPNFTGSFYSKTKAMVMFLYPKLYKLFSCALFSEVELG